VLVEDVEEVVERDDKEVSVDDAVVVVVYEVEGLVVEVFDVDEVEGLVVEVFDVVDVAVEEVDVCGMVVLVVLDDAAGEVERTKYG